MDPPRAWINLETAMNWGSRTWTRAWGEAPTRFAVHPGRRARAQLKHPICSAPHLTYLGSVVFADAADRGRRAVSVSLLRRKDPGLTYTALKSKSLPCEAGWKERIVEACSLLCFSTQRITHCPGLDRGTWAIWVPGWSGSHVHSSSLSTPNIVTSHGTRYQNIHRRECPFINDQIKSIANAIYIIMTFFCPCLNPGEYPPRPSMYHK